MFQVPGFSDGSSLPPECQLDSLQGHRASLPEAAELLRRHLPQQLDQTERQLAQSATDERQAHLREELPSAKNAVELWPCEIRSRA